jgi:hypothetical protein
VSESDDEKAVCVVCHKTCYWEPRSDKEPIWEVCTDCSDPVCGKCVVLIDLRPYCPKCAAGQE